MLAKDCGSKVELMFLQDLSASFSDYLVAWQANAIEFTRELDSRLPDTIYSIGSFRDKPFPFVGYGWGDFRNGLLKDYCYALHSEFVGEEYFPDSIRSIPPASGGNDIAENQFEAMMNGVYDPVMRWSDDDEVIKLMILVTNSTAHGVNLSGKDKASGGKWTDTTNYTRGWDYWWAAKYWKDSYGRQYIADEADNYPYHSFVWDTASEFYYHQDCGANSEAVNNYVILGEKIDKYGIQSLTVEEEARWDKAMKACDPVDPYDYIGVANAEELGTKLHPDRFVPNEDCLSYEYPNQQQALDALKSKNIIPIIISITPKAEGHADSTAWHKFAYGCTQDTEVDCVAEFYEDILADAGNTEGKVLKVIADSASSYESWSDAVFKIIEDAVSERCPTTTPSPEPAVTTESPVVTTEAGVTTGEPGPEPCPDCPELEMIAPVCDTTNCKTFINHATWKFAHPDRDDTTKLGVCTRFDGCCQ